jgi:hypothetical protein
VETEQIWGLAVVEHFRQVVQKIWRETTGGVAPRHVRDSLTHSTINKDTQQSQQHNIPNAEHINMSERIKGRDTLDIAKMKHAFVSQPIVLQDCVEVHQTHPPT